MKLSDARVFMRVRYVPGHAHGDLGHKDCEDGIVTSMNEKNVFVKFDKQAWTGQPGQACTPEDLVAM